MADTEEPRGTDLREQLKQGAQRAATGARDAAEQGKDRLADGARGVAQALHHASEGLRSDQREDLARYTDAVASQLEQLAGSLKGRDLATLAGDVTRLARQQPALFLGGAFTAGLLAARFLKSSGKSGEPSRTSSTPGGDRPEATSSGQK